MHHYNLIDSPSCSYPERGRTPESAAHYILSCSRYNNKRHWFFYLLLQHGVTALCQFLHFYFVLFVYVCLSVCLSFYVSVCICVSVFVCLSVRVSVCLYVYMYVVFIVINVSRLLHVSRPTSSPRAVWNPCKIDKA